MLRSVSRLALAPLAWGIVVREELNTHSVGRAEPVALAADAGEDFLSGASAGFTRNCLVAPPETSTCIDGSRPLATKNQPPPYKERPIRLAMMMFVKNSVFNADVWHAWLEQAKKDQLPFRFVIHTKEDANQTMDKRLLKHVSERRVWNDACNLIGPQYAIMEPLLAEPRQVSHFMMLSENSVPVKPLKTIYQELEKEPVSRFCGDDNWCPRRAESWWMMRREDIEWFVEFKDDIRQHMGSRGCIDENMWYRSMTRRKTLWPDHVQVRNECWMYTDWKMTETPCKNWARVADMCDCPNLRQMEHKNATSGHPVFWHKVNAGAFDELVRSPFWFARKFSEGAVPLEAARSLFH